MTEKIELPPLPEPNVQAMKLPRLPRMTIQGYTADQMRSYASEAVRMAVEAEREAMRAKIQEVAEELHDNVNRMSNGAPVSERDCWMLELAEQLDAAILNSDKG